jgi:hypothetical protein
MYDPRQDGLCTTKIIYQPTPGLEVELYSEGAKILDYA